MSGAELEEYEPSTELVVAPQASATLFRTDEPGEIIARATQVANALSGVLRAKNLTTRIGSKEHVQVEGWTLCGAMLGVFPVVVWSRPLSNGWEARAEARTQTGAVVGAAEAQCTRDEKEWGASPTRGKMRDDYALRSMAQTRAISKALRLPLGFIVTLAGFSATPAEEIEVGGNAQPEIESDDFDPGVHLAPGAIKGEGFLEQLGAAFKAIDPAVDWKDVLNQIAGDAPKDETFWRRVSNAVAKLGDLSSFPPPDDDAVIAAFAWAFEGTVVELTREMEVELDEEAAAAAERDEDAPLTGDEVEAALASDDDDVPFGEEEADAT